VAAKRAASLSVTRLRFKSRSLSESAAPASAASAAQAPASAAPASAAPASAPAASASSAPALAPAASASSAPASAAPASTASPAPRAASPAAPAPASPAAAAPAESPESERSKVIKARFYASLASAMAKSYVSRPVPSSESLSAATAVTAVRTQVFCESSRPILMSMCGLLDEMTFRKLSKEQSIDGRWRESSRPLT
jgi:hypothetical protein